MLFFSYSKRRNGYDVIKPSGKIKVQTHGGLVCTHDGFILQKLSTHTDRHTWWRHWNITKNKEASSSSKKASLFSVSLTTIQLTVTTFSHTVIFSSLFNDMPECVWRCVIFKGLRGKSMMKANAFKDLQSAQSSSSWRRFKFFQIRPPTKEDVWFKEDWTKVSFWQRSILGSRFSSLLRGSDTQQ